VPASEWCDTGAPAEAGALRGRRLCPSPHCGRWAQ